MGGRLVLLCLGLVFWWRKGEIRKWRDQRKSERRRKEKRRKRIEDGRQPGAHGWNRF